MAGLFESRESLIRKMSALKDGIRDFDIGFDSYFGHLKDSEDYKLAKSSLSTIEEDLDKCIDLLSKI